MKRAILKFMSQILMCNITHTELMEIIYFSTVKFLKRFVLSSASNALKVQALFTELWISANQSISKYLHLPLPHSWEICQERLECRVGGYTKVCFLQYNTIQFRIINFRRNPWSWNKKGKSDSAQLSSMHFQEDQRNLI